MQSKKDRRKFVADECSERGVPKLYFSLALAGGRQVICQFLFAMCIDAVAGVPVAVIIKAAGHAWLLKLKRRERHAQATRIVLHSFRHAWSLEKIREMKSVLPSSFPSPLAARPAAVVLVLLHRRRVAAHGD
jgi:hypothetical protein